MSVVKDLILIVVVSNILRHVGRDFIGIVVK